MNQIKAAVLRGADTPFSIETVNLEDPRPGQILVRVEGVGFCHTDMAPRRPGYPARFPLVLGHEAAGVVESVGTDVSGVALGDHVVLSFDSCGTCAACRTGRPAYCAEFATRNLTGWPGQGRSQATDQAGEAIGISWFGQASFATHALATARNAVVVDPALPLEVLAPLGCGIQTGAGAVMNVFGLQPGESIAVFGAGSVGLAAVMAAKASGATTIIAVDIHRSRLDMALACGATAVIDGSEPAAAAQIRSASGGGVLYSFDTTGSNEVINTAFASLGPGGTCGLVATPEGGLLLDCGRSLPGRTVVGIIEGNAVPQVFIPKLIDLWRQGAFPFDRLITTFPLSEINEAEKASKTGEVIKPVLAPGQPAGQR
jgi:aryl-alcohol dehydrogenase